MAKRFQTKEHQFVFKFIAARDGAYCLHCQSTGTKRYPLEIDHQDADIQHNDPENLHILCKKCNLLKRGLTIKEQIKMIQKDCARNVSERERENGHPSTGTVKTMVDYSSGGPEMQVNEYAEISFRDWVLRTIKKHGMMSKSDAIHGGAEVAGCSSVTTSRYLQKLTSSQGVLEQSKSAAGVIIQYSK